ncbi:flagellin [Candidatus Fukatsuia endosymbiont of Tuberolachnus salignus]
MAQSSVHTNPASIAAKLSMSRAGTSSTKFSTQAATGYRINGAADDAAGLQIAGRLDGELSGMRVGIRNISDAKFMLQTAEGAFQEMKDIMIRMKDLSMQAANDTNSPADKKAMNDEFKELHLELINTIQTTSYSGERLLHGSGVLSTTSGANFQIGSASGAKLAVSLKDQLKKLTDIIGLKPAEGFGKIDLAASGGKIATEGPMFAASGLIAGLSGLSAIRSKLGATINRLDHTSRNLENMVSNTEKARGNLMDTDFAVTLTDLARSQMLEQTSMAMLQKSNQSSQMILGLLR